jgi:hypothetical protein
MPLYLMCQVERCLGQQFAQVVMGLTDGCPVPRVGHSIDVIGNVFVDKCEPVIIEATNHKAAATQYMTYAHLL